MASLASGGKDLYLSGDSSPFGLRMTRFELKSVPFVHSAPLSSLSQFSRSLLSVLRTVPSAVRTAVIEETISDLQATAHRALDAYFENEAKRLREQVVETLLTQERPGLDSVKAVVQSAVEVDSHDQALIVFARRAVLILERPDTATASNRPAVVTNQSEKTQWTDANAKDARRLVRQLQAYTQPVWFEMHTDPGQVNLQRTLAFIVSIQKLNPNFHFRFVVPSPRQISTLTKFYAEAGGRKLGDQVQVISERELETYRIAYPPAFIVTSEHIMLPEGAARYDSGTYQDGSRIVYGEAHVKPEHLIAAAMRVLIDQQFQPKRVYRAESEAQLMDLELIMHAVTAGARMLRQAQLSV